MNNLSKITFVFFLSLALLSCNKESDMSTDREVLIKLEESTILTDQVLLNKVKKNLETIETQYILTDRSSDLLTKLDFSKATISSYENSDIQSITIPTSEGFSYTTFSKDNKVAQEGMMIKIENNSDYETATYFDLNLSPIGKMNVKDGEILSAEGFSKDRDDLQNNLRGWWGTWGDCVGVNLNKMTDGSVEGSIYGLACIAFGPECAAGVAIGCAVAATFF